MYNHNKAQQSKNRVHISWDILYINIYKECICMGYLISVIAEVPVHIWQVYKTAPVIHGITAFTAQITFYRPRGLGDIDIPMLKSALVCKTLQTRHLIFWRHSRQPIGSYNSPLTNMEFNMDFTQ